MKSFTEPMEPERFYHLYNKGVNGCNLFLTEKHYCKFMEKYAFHTEKIVTTYSYSLLKNHFHFVIRVKSEAEIRVNFPFMAKKEIDQIISSQFAHLFNGYAQYFNLLTGRTGKLFELPFLRKRIDSDNYLSQLIFYIHANPQKHGLISDFKDYKFSSFQALLSEAPSRLARKEVLKWFGGKEGFLKFHQQNFDTIAIENLIMEKH